jgi:hypothetical protein
MTNKAKTLEAAKRNIGSAISAARYALAGLEALHADPCPDPAQAEAAAIRIAEVCETASVHAYVAAGSFKSFGRSE